MREILKITLLTKDVGKRTTEIFENGKNEFDRYPCDRIQSPLAKIRGT